MKTKDSLFIAKKIHEIRGMKVMLDADLAELFGVSTNAFNQAVKRNMGRFRKEFMLRLSDSEWENLRSQFVTSSWGTVEVYHIF